MRPIGMDKNKVLIYEGDIVLCDENKYKAYVSELTGELLLIPYIEGLNDGGTLGWAFTVPGAVEVVNVSDRTNYDRYFADLCVRDKIYDYICRGTLCCDCVVDETLCKSSLVFSTWIDEPAVKL